VVPRSISVIFGFFITCFAFRLLKTCLCARVHSVILRGPLELVEVGLLRIGWTDRRHLHTVQQRGLLLAASAARGIVHVHHEDPGEIGTAEGQSRWGLVHRAGGAAAAVTARGGGGGGCVAAAALGGATLDGIGMDARDGDGGYSGDALVKGLGGRAIAGSCRGGH